MFVSLHNFSIPKIHKLDSPPILSSASIITPTCEGPLHILKSLPKLRPWLHDALEHYAVSPICTEI